MSSRGFQCVFKKMKDENNSEKCGVDKYFINNSYFDVCFHDYINILSKIYLQHFYLPGKIRFVN